MLFTVYSFRPPLGWHKYIKTPTKTTCNSFAPIEVLVNSGSSQCSLIPGTKGYIIYAHYLTTQKRAYHINTEGGAWSYGYLYRDYTAAIQDLVLFTPTQLLVWRQLVGPSHWPDRPQQRGIKCTVCKAMQPLPPARVYETWHKDYVCVCVCVCARAHTFRAVHGTGLHAARRYCIKPGHALILNWNWNKIFWRGCNNPKAISLNTEECIEQ